MNLSPIPDRDRGLSIGPKVVGIAVGGVSDVITPEQLHPVSELSSAIDSLIGQTLQQTN